MKKTILILFFVSCFILAFFLAYKTYTSSTSSNNNQKTNEENSLTVLMYHHFDEVESSTVVSKENFHQQMKYLKEQGYITVSEKEILDYYEKGTPLPKKALHITIDDGYTSNYEIAYPILKEFNMKATIFVVVDQMGTKPGNFPHFDWKEAKEMQESGLIEIQGHTYNLHYKHIKNIMGKEKEFPALTDKFEKNKQEETDQEFEKRIFDDLVKAKTLIEENLGNEVISMAYPYGAFNEKVVEVTKKAGYKIAYTVKPGVNIGKDVEPLLLNRINVPGGYTGEDIEKDIQAQLKK